MELSHKSLVSDFADWVTRHHKPKYTDFYEPNYIDLMEADLKKYDGISCKANGGYENAERKIMVIYPEDWDYDLAFPISVLRITPRSEYVLTHRDFLGSVLGLGLKRDKIGDILINDSKAQIIVMNDIKNFIINNLTRVGNVPVTLEEIDLNDVILPEEKFKEIFTTVNSLRLDSIAGCAFKVSRSKIAEIIKVGRVKVNWKTTDNVSCRLKEGDIISVRGRGRAELYSVGGKTAKGRVRIRIKRFL
jgi:RNA-binding protein YlmH